MGKPRYRPYLSIWRVSKRFVASLVQIGASVGVRHAANPVHRAQYMHHAHVNFVLWGRALWAMLPMCTAPLCVCAALLKTTPNSLQTRALHSQSLCYVSLWPWCAQWFGCLWKLVYKDLEVMGLIFASSNPTLIMILFDTFHWFNATLNFTFPFVFLAKMMKFFGTFVGIARHGILPRKPWLHLKKSTGDFFFFLKIITNDTLFDFSWKRSFEE